MLRVGVCILPDRPWREAAPLWRRAEELGFDSLWTYDHITWGGLPDGAWYGAVPTLAAAALATSRARLGTLVSSVNFRHPVPLAQDAMTLDDLSGGRFVLGFGAGSDGPDGVVLGQGGEAGSRGGGSAAGALGTGAVRAADALDVVDAAAFGWSAKERGGRFREAVELLDLLLRSAPEGRTRTTYRGRYYTAVEARMEPGCVQRPRVPFALAAGGPLGMRTVARFGQAWVTTDDPGDGDGETAPTVADAWARLERLSAALEVECEREGRDPATLERILLTGFSPLPAMASKDGFDEVAGRAAELGFTEIVVHLPRESGPFATPVGVLEAIAAGLGGAGAS